MPDANYAVVAMGELGEISNKGTGIWGGAGTNQTVSLVRLFQRTSGGTESDSDYISVAIFR
jgi:hypothetical protein